MRPVFLATAPAPPKRLLSVLYLPNHAVVRGFAAENSI